LGFGKRKTLWDGWKNCPFPFPFEEKECAQKKSLKKPQFPTNEKRGVGCSVFGKKLISFERKTHHKAYGKKKKGII